MLIRSLFASYGAIVKLHLYRHKSKGAKIMDGNDDGSSLKGDCLVVYSLEDSVNTDSGVKDSDNDAKTNETVISRARQRLVETVCAQVRAGVYPQLHCHHDC